jgi:hypothetical protein
MLVMMVTVPMEMDAVLNARSKEDSSAKVALMIHMMFAQKFVVTAIICLTLQEIVMMETMLTTMDAAIFAR